MRWREPREPEFAACTIFLKKSEMARVHDVLARARVLL